MKNLSWAWLLCLLALAACDKKKPSTDNETPQTPVVTVKSPAFNADSAYFFVDKQVSFGPRVPNSGGHRQCGDYLVSTLRKYGAQVTVQDFVAEAYNGTKLQSRNIIGSYLPNAPKRILLAAHWDTRHVADKDSTRKNEPILGANDGGSGVGVLLEIARILNSDTSRPQIGVDIIFFDAEDYGIPDYEDQSKYANDRQYYCLGSQYWGKNLHKPGYSAYFGILLDMVGARNATFFKEGLSMQFAGGIVNRVWDIANYLQFGQYFLSDVSNQVGTDDHVFVNTLAKIPTIDIIDTKPDTGFGSYHHSHRDDMSIIDRNVLRAVGQTVLQTVYQEGAPAVQ
jgi:hypothetical protein